jgi:hypothetical protein
VARTLDAMRSATGPGARWRWVAYCAAAEAVGMSAAAAAARAGTALAGESPATADVAAVVTVVTAGGLVEGAAVGLATAAALVPLVPDLPRRRWVAVTTAVAGVGWAAGSVPAQLSAGDPAAAASPPVWLVLGGAAVVGLAMGAVLGAAQSVVLRGRVRHPWRWTAASALAWTPAMTVIFAGATTAGADWPGPAVVGLGAVTGAVAGAALGAVFGWAAPSLNRAWRGAVFRDRVAGADHRAGSGPVSRARKG